MFRGGAWAAARLGAVLHSAWCRGDGRITTPCADVTAEALGDEGDVVPRPEA